jgi:hypothetical protein
MSVSSPAVADAAPALSPTVRVRTRRSLFWIVLAVIAVIVATAALLLRGGAADGPALGADNPAPSGSMAVANVLKAQGVHLTGADTLAQARSAIGSAGDSTLLLYDPHGYLSQKKLRSLDGLATTTVLVRPGFTALRELAPGVAAAGSPPHATRPLTAGCDAVAARKAGTISAPQATYRLQRNAYAGCFAASRDTYALATHSGAGHTVWVVGSTSVFDNENALREGNAALALNLLGEHETLVWYLPTLADVDPTGPPSLGELTPGWLTPAILLLIAATVAAAIWRGRRFGPLVIENLPVLVRAGETMEGRARLYQRSSARLRALDALRIGAVGRIATRCGLPRTATSTEVADAAAALIGADTRLVRGVLIDAVPGSDAELMRLSDELAELERAVVHASGIGGTGVRAASDSRSAPPGTADSGPAGQSGRTDQTNTGE